MLYLSWCTNASESFLHRYVYQFSVFLGVFGECINYFIIFLFAWHVHAITILDTCTRGNKNCSLLMLKLNAKKKKLSSSMLQYYDRLKYILRENVLLLNLCPPPPLPRKLVKKLIVFSLWSIIITVLNRCWKMNVFKSISYRKVGKCFTFWQWFSYFRFKLLKLGHMYMAEINILLISNYPPPPIIACFNEKIRNWHMQGF